MSWGVPGRREVGAARMRTGATAPPHKSAAQRRGERVGADWVPGAASVRAAAALSFFRSPED